MKDVDKSITSAIRRLSELDVKSEFGGQALDVLATVVPYDYGTFDVVDFDSRQCRFEVRPSDAVRPYWTLETYARYLPENPYYQYVRRTSDASAHRISEFVTLPELKRLSLFREVFAPLGIRFQLAMGLPARRPAVVGIALSRARRDFTEREARQLNVLRPHVIQAYRSFRRIASYERALSGIVEALAQDDRAVLVLDEDESSVLNEKAMLLLGSYFPTAGPGRLPASIAAWVTEERMAAHSGASDLRRSLVHRRNGRRLSIRFVPGGRDRSDLLFLDERQEADDLSALQTLGLTAREAQVTGWLVRGNGLDQIAQHLEISPHTVRAHVERIYRKLGVSSRAAATALVLDALHTDRDSG